VIIVVPTGLLVSGSGISITSFYSLVKQDHRFAFQADRERDIRIHDLVIHPERHMDYYLLHQAFPYMPDQSYKGLSFEKRAVDQVLKMMQG